MMNKTKAFQERYDEITKKLAEQTEGGAQESVRLFREQKRLLPIVEERKRLERAERDLSEAQEILRSGDEPELASLAEEEQRDARRRIDASTHALEELLLSRDEDDDKNVIIEIRAGTGGEEAALFSAALLRMYQMFAEENGFRTEILSANETQLGGYKEIQFLVSGAGAFSCFKYEGGVHRVQRVPETESQGRIHTSAVTVAVLPEVEDVEVEVREEDLEVDTHRASGAGGQHINKTDSAIRILHKPTGIVVECQDERSQHKNREKAMRVLRSKLYELEQQKRADAIASERKSQVGSGDRSERIRTYNFPQGRVSDHRIGLTVHNLDAVLNGKLSQIVGALREKEREERLRELSV